MSRPTKKLLNEVESCVDESLYGATALNPGLMQLKGHRVIIRADLDEFKAAGKVTTVCGGGSGHEPTWYGRCKFYVSFILLYVFRIIDFKSFKLKIF